MKTLHPFLLLATLLLLTFSACNKENNALCIDGISQTSTMQIGQITINVPGEQSYTGIGALPGPFKFGKYSGQISSVITRQGQTETGLVAELRHYFDDGKGNQFWTHDHAVLTPLDATMTKFSVYDEMAIWVGTGDFKCAGGMLVNKGVVDFATSKLDVNVSGTVCGGCD